MREFDLAIVGSGFGGSLLAMVARRIGLSVILFEKGSHPRFAIGESTSPLTNLLLETISQRYGLPRLMPLTSYGLWQRAYPEIVCGLKRGFTFFHHEAGKAYSVSPGRENQLLVAASPHDELADMHWLRSDVDRFFQQEAVASGAEYLDHALLNPPAWDATGLVTLSGQREGRPFQYRVRVIVDATGPRGYLHRSLNLQDRGFSSYPSTQALYTHFFGVRRCETMPEYETPGTPPYPIDDAALHHIFDGGWMWVLRFNNGITSAGVAMKDALANDLGLSDGAPAWPRVLARFPTIGHQFDRADAIRPFVYTPKLSFRSEAAAGPDWAMLPSAAAFIDPLFSTGIPLTLLGIERLGRILQETWGTKDLPDRLAGYGETTLHEADVVASFIAGCYGGMVDFPIFTALSMFYFAAASYSEMARRLEKPHLVRRFLAADHAQFGPALLDCADWARSHGDAGAMGVSDYAQTVANSVECINVAGLCDPAKRNWYPVDLNDVVAGAQKLGFESEEMKRILASAPWAQIPDKQGFGEDDKALRQPQL